MYKKPTNLAVIVVVMMSGWVEVMFQQDLLRDVVWLVNVKGYWDVTIAAEM